MFWLHSVYFRLSLLARLFSSLCRVCLQYIYMYQIGAGHFAENAVRRNDKNIFNSVCIIKWYSVAQWKTLGAPALTITGSNLQFSLSFFLFCVLIHLFIYSVLVCCVCVCVYFNNVFKNHWMCKLLDMVVIIENNVSSFSHIYDLFHCNRKSNCGSDRVVGSKTWSIERTASSSVMFRTAEIVSRSQQCVQRSVPKSRARLSEILDKNGVSGIIN